MEGRDAAGKGSTIKRFIENMMPKAVKVIELGCQQKAGKELVRTWEKRLPQEGKIHFLIEVGALELLIQPAMGYYEESQYKYFMKKINSWEEEQINKGLILIKFYLSISKENARTEISLREKQAL